MQEKEMRNRLAFEVSATGEVRFDDAKSVKPYLATLPAGSYYLHPKKLTPYRSIEQNSLIWRTYAAFADHINKTGDFRDYETGAPIRVTSEIIHLWLKKKFSHLLPSKSIITPDGELIEMDVTTTKLHRFDIGENAKHFSDYYEAVLQFIGEQTNYSLNI